MSGSSASLLALRFISPRRGAARAFRSIVASRADNAARSAKLRSYFSWASPRSIGVLNSCTIVQTEWSEYGYIGDSGIDALRELGAERIDRPTYKIMALHHHLLPVTNVATLNNKGITLSVDAPRILDAAQQAGVQLAVHGHEHMPRVVKYDNQPLAGAPQQAAIYVVSHGSTGVSPVRRPGNERNTYCIFRLSDKEMHLTMRELRPDGKVGLSLFSGNLDISPILPKAAA
ncbi:hypothetical protein NKJ73_26720 [Mesorhizobium sp. M0074]|uniref:metallophosphoesterase family protein n=1 Tax=Mesorhizobium sp. M0074 TaxID=2956869 RepID=UPI00333B97B3